MILEIITPDNLIYKGEIESITLPGLDGYFGILNSHAPMISALGKGDLTIGKVANEEAEGTLADDASGSGKVNFNINGGVVEVLNNKVVVLAE